MRGNHAIHSIELASGLAPEWVHLIPSGHFQGRDGRGPYLLADPQAVIAATLAHQGGADAPIDYDHQTYRSAENGQPAPAAGWFKEFQARADGIWGRVEWTAKAAEHLKNREYRYLSPAFVHDEPGNVLRIEGAGLVNNPNLELTALASKLPGGETTVKPEDFLKQLAGLFKLPEGSTAEAVVTHAQGVLSDLAKAMGVTASTYEQLAVHVREIVETHKSNITDLAKAMGAPDKATPEQLVTHAKSLKAVGEPDPGKFVSLSVHNALAGKLESLEKERSEEKAQASVARAKAEGKLIPAQEDWALALASKDPAGFESWAKAAPVVVSPHSVALTGQPQADTGNPSALAGEITAYMSKQAEAGREIGYAQALSEIKQSKGGSL